MTSSLPSSTSDELVSAVDRNGTPRTILDFRDLSFCRNIRLELRRAFLSEFGHNSLETQRQVWRCLRKFSRFSEENKTSDAAMLSSDILLRFRAWLDGQDLRSNTKQSILNVVVTIIKWLERNSSATVASGIRFDIPPYRREPSSPRTTLSSDALRSILMACHADIENIERRIEKGKACLLDSSLSEVAVLIKDLLRIGNGQFPSQRIIGRAKNSYSRRVIDAGGIRRLTRMISLTPVDLLPFFINVLMLTSGNPMAVLEIRRDCIRKHPLRDDIEWVVWEKRRSHGEQKIDSLTGREWALGSVIKRLLKLNEDAVAIASKAQRAALFLCLSEHGARVPTFQMFHLWLSEFIDRHELPDFDFRDLRVATANAIYAECGDVVAVKRRLNHKSIRTTYRYLNVCEVRERNERIVHAFQGKIVLLAGEGSEADERIVAARTGRAYDTVFGFRCGDPMGGIAPGSKPGVPCPSFQRCATCPGAVVPLDDPHVVARLINTFDTLRECRSDFEKRGRSERFEVMYAPTLHVLEEQLLPRVTASVRAAALRLLPKYRLPRLE